MWVEPSYKHHMDMDVRLIWHIGHCNNALMDVEVRACLLVLDFIFYNMHLYEPQHSSIINGGRRYHPAPHCCCAVGHSGQWFSRVLTSPFTANICLCLLFHLCYFHSSQTVLMCLWRNLLVISVLSFSIFIAYLYVVFEEMLTQASVS